MCVWVQFFFSFFFFSFSLRWMCNVLNVLEAHKNTWSHARARAHTESSMHFLFSSLFNFKWDCSLHHLQLLVRLCVCVWIHHLAIQLQSIESLFFLFRVCFLLKHFSDSDLAFSYIPNILMIIVYNVGLLILLQRIILYLLSIWWLNWFERNLGQIFIV